MKNIHLLPTEKPSRLHYSKQKGYVEIVYKLILNQEESKCSDGLLSGQRHIYITSDEEIKEDDWFYDTIYESVFQWKSNKPKGEFQSKIILTTDQDLIKDGIQAIDDEFLEWFCKNPSCGMVEVKEVRQRCHLSLRDWVDEDENGEFPMSIAGAFAYRRIYKIIIPQEEPKQEEINMFTKGKKYIQQDGVVILAGENGTNGIVISDHKKMWGVGHYSDEWNPKAFKLLEEPKEQAKEIEKEQKGYSVEEVIILLKSRITEIHLRKDNILKHKDNMPQHLLEGGVLGFHSSIDAIEELVRELLKQQEQ